MLSPIEGSHATFQEKTRLACRLSRNDTRIQKDENGASANNQLRWVTFSRRFSHGRPHNAAMKAPVRIMMSGNNIAASDMSINHGKIDLPVYIVMMRISKRICSGPMKRSGFNHTCSVLVSFDLFQQETSKYSQEQVGQYRYLRPMDKLLFAHTSGSSQRFKARSRWPSWCCFAGLCWRRCP